MNQKHQEIALALEPLVTLFNELNEKKMALYAEALEKFDIATIKKSVLKVRDKWDRVSFPPPGVIVQECERIDEKPGHRSIHEPMQWEDRDQRIRASANEYWINFTRVSSTYAEATADSWDRWLSDYVKEVAHVQAQLIYTASNLAIRWTLIQPGALKGDEIWKFQKDFIKEQKRIAATGSIDVAIPTGKIDEWRRMGSIIASRRGMAA